MFEHLAIVAAATVFGIQHSGISALRVKHWIIDRWGAEGYSRIFNVTSVLALIPHSCFSTTGSDFASFAHLN